MSELESLCSIGLIVVVVVVVSAVEKTKPVLGRALMSRRSPLVGLLRRGMNKP